VLLLPYHCHYSPFELTGAQAKSCFADKNNAFRSTDVEQLTHEAVDKIPTSAWNGGMQCMEELQEQGFQREISLDSEMEFTTVNFRDLDTEVSEVNDEDDESIYIVLVNSD
jgi:hypothetical protein